MGGRCAGNQPDSNIEGPRDGGRMGSKTDGVDKTRCHLLSPAKCSDEIWVYFGKKNLGPKIRV